MRVLLSIATSADGYIDDCSSSPLALSSPEDWAEVYDLRAEFDAILVGASTIRNDNPSLRIKNPELRTRRERAGMAADIARVTVTASGQLPPDAKFFTGEGEAIVVTSCAGYTHPSATVLHVDDISAASIVAALERHGIGSLFVEGGARTAQMFLAERMVDTMRLAVNPVIHVGDPSAPHFDHRQYIADTSVERYELGGMKIELYHFGNRICDMSADERFMRMAIEQSRRSVPCSTAYRVGAVVVTAAGEIFAGYTHESSATSHAEQDAVRKALAAGADLRHATIYTSMEPCTSRKSEPESCSQLIIRHGFGRVVFALFEPDCLASCNGAATLRSHGIRVDTMPRYAAEVCRINSHICGQKRQKIIH